MQFSWRIYQRDSAAHYMFNNVGFKVGDEWVASLLWKPMIMSIGIVSLQLLLRTVLRWKYCRIQNKLDMTIKKLRTDNWCKTGEINGSPIQHRDDRQHMDLLSNQTEDHSKWDEVKASVIYNYMYQAEWCSEWYTKKKDKKKCKNYL